MEFSIKTRLPSGSYIRLPELKNKDFFTILKFCENSDLEGLNAFFDSTILKGFRELSILDKFYALLLTRMVYIEPEIFFNDESGRSINFSIENILEKIDLHESDYDKTYNFNNFEIKLGLPNLLYFENLNDIYLSVIKSIKVSGQAVKFNTLGIDDRELILSNIPNAIFTLIKDYINELSTKLNNLIVIERNDSFNIEEINLNVLSNGIISFILSIYSSGLSNFFDMLYVFTGSLGFTAKDFFNLTPRDSRVILNIYKKEMSRKEDKLKSKNIE